MSSIASRVGHFWQTIWDHPNNQALKQKRADPEVLLAGDAVFIPELRPKKVAVPTRRVSVFKRKGVPVQVRFRVQDVRGKVLPNLRYELRVGEHVYSGVTDSDGKLEQFVAPTAQEGVLTVFNDHPAYPARMQWTLQIGHLDPIDTLAGVQARLANLGFDLGDERDAEGPRTEAALRAFQKSNGIEPTGRIDGATRDKLRSAYGH
jgi:putative peptidoglycan binding protein